MATSKIENRLNADYVTERGTSGIWNYRKWKSGVAECWGTTTTGTAYTMSANGAIYGSSDISCGLPSGLFASQPNVQAQTSMGGGFWVKVGGATTKDNIVYTILRTVNSVGNITVKFYCIGGVIRRLLNTLQTLSFERGWA